MQHTQLALFPVEDVTGSGLPAAWRFITPDPAETAETGAETGKQLALDITGTDVVTEVAA
ncbi:hypothetical protein MTQ13_03325 [Streptomyces sp. XM4011]|uniref:hypothetical protein n=1 Tax=Streptomyces sp. XM4011 TaxID=2929780 RepID=UPI001FF84A17|nr:hypothetical protein [Streptomyces sp. XM4011]MCK1813311.1 hypothetical protein [Streptomyces sp. XM4011]